MTTVNKFVIPSEVNVEQVENMVRDSHSRGNLPCILCMHHMGSEKQPTHKLFLNICGTYGMFGGCDEVCIPVTMATFISKNVIRCLECSKIITLDSPIKIKHDEHNNSYLYCSSKCLDNAPQKMTKCVHINTYEFISTDRTQFYYGNDPNIQYVRRTCKNCPIVYPTENKLHCYECKKPMEPTRTSIVGIIESGRHFIHKNGSIYLVCGSLCIKKMERMNKYICQKCGLFGTKCCTKCGTAYCSRKCQVYDWDKHKSTCTIISAS